MNNWRQKMIICESMEQFLDILAGLTERGVAFNATVNEYGKFTVQITGY